VRIGLIAMSGVRVRTKELAELGVRRHPLRPIGVDQQVLKHRDHRQGEGGRWRQPLQPAIRGSAVGSFR
jgi:hypothetical protein